MQQKIKRAQDDVSFQPETSEFHFKNPLHVGIKEIIAVISVLVSVLTAWGAFQTQMATLKDSTVRNAQAIDLLQQDVVQIQRGQQQLREELLARGLIPYNGTIGESINQRNRLKFQHPH